MYKTEASLCTLFLTACGVALPLSGALPMAYNVMYYDRLYYNILYYDITYYITYTYTHVCIYMYYICMCISV